MGPLFTGLQAVTLVLIDITLHSRHAPHATLFPHTLNKTHLQFTILLQPPLESVTASPKHQD